MDNIFKHIIGFIEGFFAETAIILLLVGIVFLLIGLFIVIASVVQRLIYPSVNGKVVGAVIAVKSKEKTVDGKRVKKSKEWLYPIFEYTDQDGSPKRIRGSSGGTHVLKYATGQAVNLIIDDEKYNVAGTEVTATDTGGRTGFYFGFFFAALGLLVIYLAASILASLTIGALAIIGIVISILVRGKGKIKPNKVKKNYIYDLKDMRPVEGFINEYPR